MVENTEDRVFIGDLEIEQYCILEEKYHRMLKSTRFAIFSLELRVIAIPTMSLNTYDRRVQVKYILECIELITDIKIGLDDLNRILGEMGISERYDTEKILGERERIIIDFIPINLKRAYEEYWRYQ